MLSRIIKIIKTRDTTNPPKSEFLLITNPQILQIAKIKRAEIKNNKIFIDSKPKLEIKNLFSIEKAGYGSSIFTIQKFYPTLALEILEIFGQ